MLIFPKFENIKDSIDQNSYSPQKVKYSVFKRNQEKTDLICKPEKDDKIAFILLENKMKPINKILPEVLYSFIKGRDYFGALKRVSGFINEHYRRDKKNIYIFKTDIIDYGYSIPLNESSKLWEIIKKISLQANIVESNNYNEFETQLKRTLRLVSENEGYEYQACRGLPFGLNLTNLITNIYLNPLDSYFVENKKKEVLYTRYGDDILLISTDEKIIENEIKIIKSVVADLSLVLNENKTNLYYLNRTGNLFNKGKFTGVTDFHYLGHSIDFKGEVGISREKISNLFRYLRINIKNKSRNLEAHRIEDKGRIICEAVNSLLKDSSNFKESIPDKTCMLTSKSQMRDIDYKIQRLVISNIYNGNSIFNMRKLSRKTLMKDWKLRSIKNFVRIK